MTKKRNARLGVIAGAIVGSQLATGKANAQYTEGSSQNTINLSTVDGVENARVLSDGSVEVRMADGRVVRLDASDVVVQGDTIFVSPDVIGDLTADGGGSFVADNAIAIAAGVVAGGVGIAAAAGAFSSDDDDDNDVVEDPVGDDAGFGETDGDDVITGTAGADVINALGGNDQIDGLEGDDIIDGGPGNDLITGGAGVDNLVGADGDDSFIVDAQDSVIDGGEGADTIDLSASTEAANVDLDVNTAGVSTPNADPSQTGRLTLGENADQTLTDIENIIGTAQDDVLFGNSENNVIDAGAGNDRVHGFGGADTLDGGEGTDIILLNQAGAGVTIDLANGTVGGSTLTNFEDANGGQFDDVLIGDDGANLLIGGGGADTFNGNGGDDTFRVDELDPSIDGGEGADTIDLSGLSEGVNVDLDVNTAGFATAGADPTQDGRLTVGSNPDQALTDIENIIGTAQDDVLFGNSENNVIDAGAGDDRVHGFGGADTLDGGEGTDIILLNQAGAGVTIDLANGTVGASTITNFEDANGGRFEDVLIGDENANLLIGGGASDTLTGGAGADQFAFNGDPFDGADVSEAGRQIIGNEDFITDFDFENDAYRLNAGDFAVEGDVVFQALDANDPAATIAAGTNVIVLLNSDNDGDDATPFLAGTAAGQIADLVDTDGAGFFVYFNSNLGVNRLVYSTNLNDATADLKIVSRQTDLTGDEAIAALNNFSADNFIFENVDAEDDTIAVAAVADGDVISGGAETVADALAAADIATGDTLDLSGAASAASVDLDVSNQALLNPGPITQEGNLTIDGQSAVLVDIENVIGTDFDDVLFGNAESNVILGGAGNDNIHPFQGVDFADGGDGTDVLNLSGGGGFTIDLAAGTAGTNTFVNFENVLGSVNGDDLIFGDDGVNDLNGRGQDDLLNGRGGSDTLTGGDGADLFAFDGDPFDGADVSEAGRQIIGNEDFITDFDFANDAYQLNAGDFGVTGDVAFQALDANAVDADITDGTNVVVLLNADNDGDDATPFLAGTAAGQIADLVDTDGAGFFVYFNTNLGVNRLVYSTNLNDATADLKIVSRQTDLTDGDAIAALNNFSADNFVFENVQDLVFASAQAIDETGGDFSDDISNPTQFTLGLGDNTLVARQQGDAESGGRDIDYVTIEVPIGLQLSAVTLTAFDAAAGNQAFIGVQEGPVFTVDAASAGAGDLLGGIVYGSGQVGTDILDDIGSLGGSTGFTGPLDAGTYTFWLNQTGPASTASLTFTTEVVPAASSVVQASSSIFADLSDDEDDVAGFADAAPVGVEAVPAVEEDALFPTSVAEANLFEVA